MSLQRVCLVHYHEIGLKGKNRSHFEKQLVTNIKSVLGDAPIARIKRISGRICLFVDMDVTYERSCELVDLVAGIPGVARVSCGYRCEQSLKTMYDTAIQALSDVPAFETFKVQARRNHTDFEIDSMQLNQLVGAALCRAFQDKKVLMKNPDVEVRVEVIEGHCYIYAHSIVGVGGLPVGTAGKVVTLMSSGIDSPVATWRIARRGAIPIGVHFSGRPETVDTSEFLVDDIAHVLERTGCFARLYVVPIGEYQRRIAESAPASLRIVLYRRFMYAIAQRIAEREGAKALVTGESLGQVASQTLDNIQCTNAAVSLPVLRPLIGSDKVEIIAEAERIGTFEISSQDAPDCCTLYMPRNPETHAKLPVVLKAEQDLPIDTWIEEAMESLEVHDYRCPSYRKNSEKR
jgi:thiamine biosynthesis protein ThiI